MEAGLRKGDIILKVDGIDVLNGPHFQMLVSSRLGGDSCTLVVQKKKKDSEPIEVGPAYPKSMRAWHVLDESLSPLKDVPLTDGAIRNQYISLTGTSDKMRRRPVTLLMPDGQEVQTAFATGKAMLKWRGWGAYYVKHRMKPGDAVRFVALSPGRYRVTFRKQP